MNTKDLLGFMFGVSDKILTHFNNNTTLMNMTFLVFTEMIHDKQPANDDVTYHGTMERIVNLLHSVYHLREVDTLAGMIQLRDLCRREVL